MINQATAKKLAELYIEATGLIVKLTNIIKHNDVPNSKLHIEQATDFIERDDFYKYAVTNLLTCERLIGEKDKEDEDLL